MLEDQLLHSHKLFYKTLSYGHQSVGTPVISNQAHTAYLVGNGFDPKFWLEGSRVVKVEGSVSSGGLEREPQFDCILLFFSLA